NFFPMWHTLKRKTLSRTPHGKGERHEAPPADHPSRSETHLCRSLEVGAGTRTLACPHCSAFCPPRTPSSSLGLSARDRELPRAQKWLALGGTRWRSPTRWHATL